MRFLFSKENATTPSKVILICTLIISIFFSIGIGNRRFANPDEGRYVEIAREMAESGDYVTPRLNGVKYFEKPPLFYWLEAASIKLMGIDFAKSRIVQCSLAVLGCLFLMIAAFKAYNLSTAVLSGGVLSTTLLYYIQSRFINLDLSLSVFMSASLWCYFLAMVKTCNIKRKWLLFGFYIFAALAVLSKGLVGVILPGLVIFVWLILNGQSLKQKLQTVMTSLYIPGIMAFLLIAVPWHVICAQRNPGFAYFYLIYEHFVRYASLEHMRYQPVWFFCPILLIALIPWTGICCMALKQSIRERRSDNLFLLSWICSIFVFFSFSNSKLIPYILPIFPPIALLTGRLLTNYIDGLNIKDVRIGFLSSIGIIVAAAIGGFLFKDLVAGALIPESIMLICVLACVFLFLLIGAMLLEYCIKDDELKRSFQVLLFLFSACNVMFLINRIAVFYQDDRKPSTYEISQAIKYNLTPGTEVFVYYHCYYDLCVFLKHTIGCIDHLGELEFGTKAEDHSDRFLGCEAFVDKFKNAKNRIFVCIARNEFDRFCNFFKCEYRILEVTKDFVLIINR